MKRKIYRTPEDDACIAGTDVVDYVNNRYKIYGNAKVTKVFKSCTGYYVLFIDSVLRNGSTIGVELVVV